MFDSGVELDIGSETAPEFGVRCGDQAKGEFTLEHENGTTGDGTLREELEDERRRYLQRGVSLC